MRRVTSVAVLGLVVVVVALLGAPPRTNAALLAIANDDSYTAKHDRTRSVTAPGVLTNDFNLLGSSRAVQDAGPSHGTLQLDADGGFRYTPNARFIGTDSFTYHVSGALVPDRATVTMTVTNSRPVAANAPSVATTGTMLSVPARGVVTSDADADGDALTAMKVSDNGSGS